MKYDENLVLKNGVECLLRSASFKDAREVFAHFNLMLEQTEYLLSYADENEMTVEAEKEFLSRKLESERDLFVVAVIDNKIVGTASIEPVGDKYKIWHRGEFAVAVNKKYWYLEIGRHLTGACIKAARKAGYEQLELSVIAENKHAINMYKKFGFIEYGRNPRGFKSRTKGYQELIYMRLEI